MLRFFPNRFQSENYITPARALLLPGEMPFTIELEPDREEGIFCFATEESMAQKLPLNLRGADFEVLQGESINSIKTGMIKTVFSPIGETRYISETLGKKLLN